MNQIDSGKSKTRIVLVGGGHVNVQVMVGLFEQLKEKDNCEVFLVSDYNFSYYSGIFFLCCLTK